MSDKIDTLHPKGDPSVNIYPNIKADNIPDSSIGKGKLSFAAQTQLYYHAIRFNFTITSSGHNGYVAFHIISESSTALNASRLIDYLSTKGFTNINRSIEVTGYEYTDSYVPIGIFAEDGSLHLFYAPGDLDAEITANGFADTIISL